MTDFTTDLERCLEVLSTGGIILYPTDTLWGLGCDATNHDAVEKLIALKGKAVHKGLIVLLGSERDVLQYVASPDLELFDFLATLIKPTTVIYNDGLGVADGVLNADGSIAIRLASDEFCRHLVKRFRKPVVSTSANFHGHPSPCFFLEIDPALAGRVDFVVQYRQHDTQNSEASSIIRWLGNGEITVIRN